MCCVNAVSDDSAGDDSKSQNLKFQFDTNFVVLTQKFSSNLKLTFSLEISI